MDAGEAPSEGNSWIMADRLTASTMTTESAATQQDPAAASMYTLFPDDRQPPPFPSYTPDNWHQPPWVTETTPWQPLPPTHQVPPQRLEEPWRIPPQLQSAAAQRLLER
eukprot:3892791-Amphidinium_carterae.1